MKNKMKYDVYESFIDGTSERMMTREQINLVLSSDEITTIKTGRTVEKGNLKYWAEEAMVYSVGLVL
jgi:hypothetical protein